MYLMDFWIFCFFLSVLVIKCYIPLIVIFDDVLNIYLTTGLKVTKCTKRGGNRDKSTEWNGNRLR